MVVAFFSSAGVSAAAMQLKNAEERQRSFAVLYPLPDIAEKIAVGVAGAQRPQNAERRLEAGERVAERQVRAHRHLARVTGEVAEPAERLADRGVARPIGVGAGLFV